MDTTRRFPRTLIEAFPNSPEYACAVERPEKRYALADMAWFGAVCVGGFTCLLVLAGIL